MLPVRLVSERVLTDNLLGSECVWILPAGKGQGGVGAERSLSVKDF